ncbi:MAG: hypothetical protein J6X23_00440 [Bacteroidaceae bacterium]|nr:hypothetical protein [Bacteroidaceae bacterium]
MHPHEGGEVAGGRSGIGLGGGLLVLLQGSRRTSHVTIGAAQDVMGEHPLVGIPVAVEVPDHLQHRAVRSEVHESLVHRLAPQQLHTHAVGMAHGQGIHLAQQDQSGVGIDVRQAVYRSQLPGHPHPSAARGGKKNHHDGEDG